MNPACGGKRSPLFPKTRAVVGADHKFRAGGLDRACWSNATPIRTIFRNAFEAAGLPYFNPHSFRKTLARLGLQRCQMGEEFQAWSQNLGHEKMATTMISYGRVDRLRQRDIVKSLWRAKGAVSTDLQSLLRAITEAR
jgi:integrase/recombinase XerD